MNNIIVEKCAPDEELLHPKVASKQVATSYKDPARIGFPATLPVEVELGIQPIEEILDAYGIAKDDWSLIKEDPTYKERAADVRERLAKEGMSFRMKAQLQAEELLTTAWALIHSDDTPYTVRADLIKSVMKWALYDTPESKALNGDGGNGFSISINFNNTHAPRSGRVIDHE